MSIQNLFPLNVYVKDFEKDEKWIKEVSAVASSAFYEKLGENGSYDATGNASIDLFTEERMNKNLVIKELQDMFVEGFYELYQSFERSDESIDEEGIATKEDIRKRISKQVGRIPMMKKDNKKSLHFHPSCAAFGIFYLTDVDNEKDGGELSIFDPAFTPYYEFTSPKYKKFQTKAGRMIIVPGYVWHEVSPYTGNDERKAIVLNLFPNDNIPV